MKTTPNLKKKLPDIFCWWLLTLTARPQLMLNQKWYQVSKLEMEFSMINIIYAALLMHAQTEKMTFSCKDDCTLMKHTRSWTYRQRSDYCRHAAIFNKDSVSSVLKIPSKIRVQPFLFTNGNSKWLMGLAKLSINFVFFPVFWLTYFAGQDFTTTLTMVHD